MQYGAHLKKASQSKCRGASVRKCRGDEGEQLAGADNIGEGRDEAWQAAEELVVEINSTNKCRSVTSKYSGWPVEVFVAISCSIGTLGTSFPLPFSMPTVTKIGLIPIERFIRFN